MSAPACVYVCACGCVCECFRDLRVTHECSPQSAGSWLSCLSSSRWFWVWAPRRPGTQTMQPPLRCLSGPLGIWWNLASLREPEQEGQREMQSDKKREATEGRGEGEGVKVMLVPVTSACKTYLSMGITFSTQKATMRKNPHSYCCCAHLQLSHGRNILSLCACLSLYHVEFLTQALTHCLKESKVCRPQTMKLQLQLLNMRGCIKLNRKKNV